jgi:hypothetical protein
MLCPLSFKKTSPGWTRSVPVLIKLAFGSPIALKTCNYIPRHLLRHGKPCEVYRLIVGQACDENCG